MNINTIIVYIMLIFMVIGVVDRVIFKGKYGYGNQFEEGIMAMGSLAMAMVGIMCFAPILGKFLGPIVSPLYRLVGADPAMVAGSILAIDMGGYQLAQSMSSNMQIQHLSGIYVGAMMGATVVFSIPVSLGIIRDADKPYLAKGMLAGFIAIPFGAFASGVIGGIPALITVINLLPSFILAILFAIGLWVIPGGMLKGFNVFAKIITVVILVSLGAAIIEGLSGIVIIPGMEPIGPQLEIIGIIAITLAGAYPLVHFITTALKKPLIKLGHLIGVNDVAAAGMIACLANNIPMFGMMKDMDEKGKIIAVAFSVCASFALGDHLGFASAQDTSVIFPMIAGKLIGGIVGILLANLLILRGRDVQGKGA